ncbi:hypothetical protein H8D36_04445 [archaeon]|nr:hypothetical protein [archaeon]MBL7057511.1 hypothetical protein [Candidatus Woesearchaeota archaeon]
MCGVIGIISKHNRDDLGALIAHGLFQQQNRGDFSAGAATIKKLDMSGYTYRRQRRIVERTGYGVVDPLTIVKGLGKVKEVFAENNYQNSPLEKLVGFMGVGQVRYPTAGYTIPDETEINSKKDMENRDKASIQPLATGTHSMIAMVHNGDIHNFNEIMNYYLNQGISQSTHNDLEALLMVFADKFEMYSINVAKEVRVLEAMKATMQEVKGTYSGIAIINNVGLVAFRDPEGRRPLFFGVRRNKNTDITDFAFASETVALDKMLFKGTSEGTYCNGKKLYDEIKPGEAMFISKDFEVTRQQLTQPKPTPCPFEIAYFQRAPSFIHGTRVLKSRELIIEQMWNEFKESKTYDRIKSLEEETIVVPIPRTAITAAIELARLSGATYSPAIEKHPDSARIFMQPTQEHRETETAANHYIFKEKVEGKIIFLVDDSIVRGTTSKLDIKYLRDLGAKEVHFFSTFPPIRHPCNHAINMKTHEELVGSGRTVAQIKKTLGLRSFETLKYATAQQIRNSVYSLEGTLCNECYAK